MATRYIGDAVIRIEYRDRGDYAGTISVPPRGFSAKHAKYAGRGKSKLVWAFEDLGAPSIGHGPGIGYDSPKAYDSMAGHAVSFGSYYTSHNRGRDVPDWAPDPELADAIAEATEWAMRDDGSYDVRRKR